MRFLPLQKSLAFAVTLVLSAVGGPVASIAEDDYKPFQTCVQQNGTGLLCFSKLPDGDKHKFVFENWNKTAAPFPTYTPPDHDQWLPGGLNARSAASILLERQLPSFGTPPNG